MSGSCIALQLEEAEALRSVYGGEDGFMWLHEPDGDDDIAEPAYYLFTAHYSRASQIRSDSAQGRPNGVFSDDDVHTTT